MFYIFKRKVVMDQPANDVKGIPVCGSKNKKVNDRCGFKIKTQVWQEEKEDCRTVFIKTASGVK